MDCDKNHFDRPGSEVRENWQFTVLTDRVVWRITRKNSTAATLQAAAFPAWNFRSIATWAGGLLDTGDVVWNKYLETPNATYVAQGADNAGRIQFSCQRGYAVPQKFEFNLATQ